jgi:hormone-sensitive lipase
MNPDVNVAIRTWNALDQLFLMKNWIRWQFQRIKHHQKVYLPRYYESLTLDKIDQWMREGRSQSIGDEQLTPRTPSDNSIYVKASQDEKIKVRILCSAKLVQYQRERQCQKLFGLLPIPTFLQHYYMNGLNHAAGEEPVEHVHEEVIIHIHGGGWVAMGSYSHQTYTRKWANSAQLRDVPIFSVDYRKAPKDPYPAAIDDCWQVYLFVRNQVHNYFNIRPKRVIIAADSAGANMALGICLLCNKYGVQQPDGLMLSYPAVDLSNKFTPAILGSFTDIIIPFAFLEICLKYYMQDPRCDPTRDPLLSPILFNNEILRRLPPIRLTVGEEDCLKDDGINFLNKIVNAGHDNIKMRIYKFLRHGYLSWDLLGAMPAARKCGEDAEEYMQELFEIARRKRSPSKVSQTEDHTTIQYSN